MKCKVLMMMERYLGTHDELILVVRGNNMMLKLNVRDENIKMMVKEFKVRSVNQIPGKELYLDVETSLFYYAPSIEAARSTRPIACKMSMPEYMMPF